MNKLLTLKQKVTHYAEVVSNHFPSNVFIVLLALKLLGHLTLSLWWILLISTLLTLANAGIELLIFELSDDEEEDLSPDIIDDGHCRFLIDRGLYDELKMYLDMKLSKDS